MERGKSRKERVDPVAANPDNLDSDIEAGGEYKVLRAQVRIIHVDRVSPLSRLVRSF